MEMGLLISSIILLLITAFYIWFVYRLLRELRQENTLYRTMLERQFKLASLPHVYCDIEVMPSSGLRLETYNVGSVPTYDLHINVIGAYTEEGMDIPTFMRTYVQPRFRKYPLQADKVGYFGIRNSLRFSMLPVQKRLDVSLILPTQPVDIYALLQYRDVNGTNYFQVYCFSEMDEKGGYRANIIEPIKAEPIERLHFHDMDDTKLNTTDKPLPFALRDFVELWNHSLSYQLTVLNTEEVGQMKELQDQ